MTPEASAAQKVRVRASQWFMRLFRNNNGVLPSPESGRPVRFGLGNESKELNKQQKSSDYIGITPIVITPEMVGQTIGVFTSIETKPLGFVIKENYREGSREWAQQNWIEMVKFAGGIAGFAAEPIHVDNIIEEFNFRVRKNDHNKENPSSKGTIKFPVPPTTIKS